jgi:hypothetical protein
VDAEHSASISPPSRHPGSQKSVVVIPGRERSETAALKRRWEWVTYLLKQLPPTVMFGDDLASRQTYVPLREVLKAGRRAWPYRPELDDVSCAKLTGSSHNLSRKAQKAAGFRSWLQWSRRDRLFDGRELDSWRKWGNRNGWPQCSGHSLPATNHYPPRGLLARTSKLV